MLCPFLVQECVIMWSKFPGLKEKEFSYISRYLNSAKFLYTYLQCKTTVETHLNLEISYGTLMYVLECSDHYFLSTQ